MLERDHAVGGRQAALEAVLGEHDRRLPLLVEPAQQPDQLVAGDRVQLRGRLVEQHQPRAARERRAERDALLLAAGELVGRAVEQRVDAERERHLLDPARDRRGAVAAALERERELGAHRAHHELRLGVLEERAGERARVGGPVLARVEARERRRARRSAPPWKCGTRPQAARSSVDLPLPESPASRQNSPGSISRLTSLERRRSRARVAVGDLLEGQERHAHRSIPRRSANGSSAASDQRRAERERAGSRPARGPAGRR